MGKIRNEYRSVVGKTEGKLPVGRQRCRWENNIKIDLIEIGREVVDWIHVAQDRDQWQTRLNLRVS
jgi:hypothetical protein